MSRLTLLLIGTLAILTACAEPEHKSKGYDGPHGIGALVDDPDDVSNWPTCSDGAQHPDCSYAPEGY